MDKLSIVEEMSRERAISERQEKDGDTYVEIPKFKAGDTVNVGLRIIEGQKERIQHFKGVVLQKAGKGVNQTFTVRKISNGIGVEKILPLYSPMIHGIEILKEGKVRRSRLYYLRGMSEKRIKAKLS